MEAAIVIGILAAAVAVRIFLNQVRTSRATSQVADALEEKDATLRETGATLQQLREVHESLMQSEARLRLLFDVAVDGIVELDADGVISRANEAFCTMMGLPQEEIMSRPWDDVAEREVVVAWDRYGATSAPPRPRPPAAAGLPPSRSPVPRRFQSAALPLRR